MKFGDARLTPLFWSRVSPEPMSGCWLWLGRVDRSGYARFHRDLAHRLVLSLATGEDRRDLQVDHVCCVVSCVNPDHLQFVTRDENMRRRFLRLVRSRTGPDGILRCLNGHALDDQNARERPGLYVPSCRECDRERQRQCYRRRRRARPDDVGTVPTPHETLAQIAERWHAELRERAGEEAR